MVAIESELSSDLAAEITNEEVAAALSEFDALWAELKSSEKVAILRSLIERIDHDGRRGSIEITFHPAGLKVLADKVAVKDEAAA